MTKKIFYLSIGIILNFYFYEKEYEHTLQIEFLSELTEENKPPIVIDDEKLDCKIDETDKKFLNCKVDLHRFRMRQNYYDGIVQNVCGLRAADILLFSWMKYPMGYMDVLYFREEQPQVRCVKELKKGTNVNFWLLSDPFYSKVPLKLDGKVQFIDKYDRSKIINTSCIADAYGFNCSSTEDAPGNGFYQGVLRENYSFVVQQENFAIGAFQTSNTLNYNSDNYNTYNSYDKKENNYL